MAHRLNGKWHPQEREHSNAEGGSRDASAATRPVKRVPRNGAVIAMPAYFMTRASFPTAPGEELRILCARDPSRTACAVKAWRRRESSKEWSLLVMALTCPAYRCRKRLRLRKVNWTSPLTKDLIIAAFSTFACYDQNNTTKRALALRTWQIYAITSREPHPAFRAFRTISILTRFDQLQLSGQGIDVLVVQRTISA